MLYSFSNKSCVYEVWVIQFFKSSCTWCCRQRLSQIVWLCQSGRSLLKRRASRWRTTRAPYLWRTAVISSSSCRASWARYPSDSSTWTSKSLLDSRLHFSTRYGRLEWGWITLQGLFEINHVSVHVWWLECSNAKIDMDRHLFHRYIKRVNSDEWLWLDFLT